MASFRTSGARFDGLGITPQHEHLPAPSDLLESGTDSSLDRARSFLDRAPGESAR